LVFLREVPVIFKILRIRLQLRADIPNAMQSKLYIELFRIIV